jgi:IS1 family transposase
VVVINGATGQLGRAAVLLALARGAARVVATGVNIQRAGEAEMDEMWSFVGKKGNQRWLWHAIDHHTGAVLAYVFGRRKDEVYVQLKALLEPFGLTRFYTDHWGSYTRHLAPEVYSPANATRRKSGASI